MVALSLKICVRQCNVVKTMQFEPSTAVYDACRVIRERVPEAQTGQASEYGLFLSDEDPRKGIWLEGGRTLDYYMLRNGVSALIICFTSSCQMFCVMALHCCLCFVTCFLIFYAEG
nr:Zgc:152648 [Danio rerio]AAI65231.1 Unknown (protein for MGC:193093) [Danio rerio]